jgi:hypothetical protein
MNTRKTGEPKFHELEPPERLVAASGGSWPRSLGPRRPAFVGQLTHGSLAGVAVLKRLHCVCRPPHNRIIRIGKSGIDLRTASVDDKTVDC